MATYEGSDWTDTFMQANYTRYFRVHVPDRPQLGPAAPLVLAFHGTSQTGTQLEAMSGLNQAADAAGFIVVYLEAAVGAWDIFDSLAEFGLDEVGYVREVIDRVGQVNVIDRNRIIAVGLSNGGVISQRLACDMADRLAGFVAVAATMPKPLADQCQPSRSVSAFYIIGTADPFFPVTGSSVLRTVNETMQLWRGLNACGERRIRSTWQDRTDDGTRAYWSRYRGCAGGSQVWMDSIVGGGHAWPDGAIAAPASFGPTSRDISANDEIIRFLEALPRE
jgi:polyhydroxybutyrate depolymerase